MIRHQKFRAIFGEKRERERERERERQRERERKRERERERDRERERLPYFRMIMRLWKMIYFTDV